MERTARSFAVGWFSKVFFVCGWIGLVYPHTRMGSDCFGVVSADIAQAALEGVVANTGMQGFLRDKRRSFQVGFLDIIDKSVYFGIIRRCSLTIVQKVSTIALNGDSCG